LEVRRAATAIDEIVGKFTVEGMCFNIVCHTIRVAAGASAHSTENLAYASESQGGILFKVIHKLSLLLIYIISTGYLTTFTSETE